MSSPDKRQPRTDSQTRISAEHVGAYDAQISSLLDFERALRHNRLESIEDEDAQLDPLKRCVGLLECYRRSRSDQKLNVPPQLPPTLGRYRLIRKLGLGGSGIVCEAEDARIGRRVALKILRPEAAFFSDMLDRFLREARAAGRLHHPNIVEVLDVGEYQGIHFIAMAYCHGPSLSQWSREHGPLTDRLASEIICKVAAALQHAHSRGVLHRDIKPGNVLLNSPQPVVPPTVPEVCLADFGLANLIDDDNKLTRTGMALGTSAYMSPEQAAGRADDVGVHSDIWSLGVVFHELLTGRTVVDAETTTAALRQIQSGAHRPFEREDWNGHPDVRAICRKCLAMEPEARYSSAAALVEDLESFLNGQPIKARRQSLTNKIRYWIHRNRVQVSVASVFFVLMALFGLASLWAANRIARAKQAVDELLYVADMRLVKAAIDASSIDEASRLLDRHLPAEGEADYRNFVWHHLRARLNREDRIYHAEDSQSQTALLCMSDRDQIVSGSEDGVLTFWPKEEAGTALRIQVHSKPIRAIATSRDGMLVASVSDDGQIALCRSSIVQVGHQPSSSQASRMLPPAIERLATWRAHQGRATAIAISPGGLFVATGGSDDAVRVWRVDTHELLYEGYPHGSTIEDLIYIDDDLVVVTYHYLERWHWQAEVGEQPPTVDRLNERIESLAPVDYTSIAASPQSATLAAGSVQGTIVLFQQEEERWIESSRLTGHTSNVYDLDFSPDGTMLVSSSKDGTVRIWDLSKQECVETLAGHSSRVYGIDYFSDGQRICSCGKDGTVRVWSVDDPSKQTVVHAGQIVSGDYEPDLSQGVFGNAWLGINRLLHSRSGLSNIPVTLSRLATPRISSGGTHLVISGGHSLVHRTRLRSTLGEVDLDNDGFTDRFGFIGDKISQCVWQKGHASGFHIPSLFDPVPREPVHVLADSMFWSSGRGLAKVSPEATVETWIAAEVLPSFRLLAVHDVDGEPGCLALLYFEQDASLALLKVGPSLQRPVQCAITLESLDQPPEQARMADFDGDGAIEIAVRFKNSSELRFFNVDEETIAPWLSANIPVDTDAFLSVHDLNADDTPDLLIADQRSVKYLHWQKEPPAIHSQDISSLEDLPLVGSASANAVVLDAQSLEKAIGINSFGHYVEVAAFSPDEQLLALATSDRMVRVWDWKKQQLLASLISDERIFYAMTFDQTGRLLCCGVQDDICVWDVERGSILHRLAGHDNSIRRLTVSPDNRILASLSHDLSVRLWDLETGEALAVLSGHVSHPMAGMFSSDGKLLATGGKDGDILVWDVKSSQPVLNLEFKGELGWVGFESESKLTAIGTHRNEAGDLTTNLTSWIGSQN